MASWGRPRRQVVQCEFEAVTRAHGGRQFLDESDDAMDATRATVTFRRGHGHGSLLHTTPAPSRTTVLLFHDALGSHIAKVAKRSTILSIQAHSWLDLVVVHDAITALATCHDSESESSRRLKRGAPSTPKSAIARRGDLRSTQSMHEEHTIPVIPSLDQRWIFPDALGPARRATQTRRIESLVCSIDVASALRSLPSNNARIYYY